MTLRWESETLSPGGPGASTAADARRWLDRRLAPALAVARRRLRMQAGLATAGLVLASGTGAYAYTSLASGTAVLAMAIPILTVLGLSPILRRRDNRLLETASTVAHDNIDVLAVLGKLIELRDPETNGHTLRATLSTPRRSPRRWACRPRPWCGRSRGPCSTILARHGRPGWPDRA